MRGDNGRKPSEVSKWLQEAEDIAALVMTLLELCRKHDRSLCDAWQKKETTDARTPVASSR